jgi:hypothetical protein
MTLMTPTEPDYYSTQLSNVPDVYNPYKTGDTQVPAYYNGKVRAITCSFTAPTGDAAAGSKIALQHLTQGLILPISILNSDDLGTGTLLNIGFGEYVKNDGTLVSANTDVLIDSLDVNAAAVNKMFWEIGTTAAKTGYYLDGNALLMAEIETGAMDATKKFTLTIFQVDGV